MKKNMEKEYSVALFYSTSSAIRAEKILLKEKYKVKLVPVPRHLSSDCGICLRFNSSLSDNIADRLEAEKIEFNGIHEL